MTLVFRLFIAALFGILLFYGYVGWLEPRLKTQATADVVINDGELPGPIARLLGQYQGSTDKGRYVLELTNTGAELRFTDRRKQEYAYRGSYTLDGEVLEVLWSEAKKAKGWEPMQPVTAKMQVQPAGVIRSAEVTFSRGSQ